MTFKYMTHSHMCPQLMSSSLTYSTFITLNSSMTISIYVSPSCFMLLLISHFIAFCWGNFLQQPV